MNCSVCDKILDSGKYLLDFIFCEDCYKVVEKPAKKLFAKYLKGLKMEQIPA